MDGVLVEKGNLAAQRWRPTATTRSLGRYQVAQSGTTIQLWADLVHELGAAGQLLESYYVSRTPDRTQPVKLDGSEWEVDFFHKPSGGESVGLVGCRGDPKYGSEPLVRVLHAMSRFNEHLVLTGFFTAQRAGLADELELYFTGMRLLSSGSMPTDVSDFFAYTRNAKGETVVDLTQEPRLFHTVFRPLTEGVSDPSVPIPERTPERIVIPDDGGRSWDPEWIEVTVRKSDGTQTTERWDVSDRYFRVDSTELTRTARASCEAPKVFLVGYFQPNGVTDSFQLVTCPAAAAPGYSLLAVVPVWFGASPALVGTRFDKGITAYQVSGRAGHRVPLGSFTATFTTADGKAFTQEIVDANGKVVGTYTSEASELSQYTGSRVETLKAAAGDVSMTLARQWAGVGVGKSSVYVPLSFSLTFSGRTVLVDAMDALRYANTHHNWEDSLEARGEGLVLRWRTSFDTGTQHEVQVTTDAGQELLPWTELKQQ